jgi:anti-sigma regulatory factor (Ser/Thr protein kinase)
MAATTTRRGNNRGTNRGGNAERSPSAPPAPRAPRAAQAAPDSLTIAAVPGNVRRARAFVAEVLGPGHPCADTAVLLCSELVTNAVLHSNSRWPGGTVTVTVASLTSTDPDSTDPADPDPAATGPAAPVRVEVIDQGSASSIPVVKADSYAPDGHGLFLVQNLAQQWGYESGDAGTTVWFRLIP